MDVYDSTIKFLTDMHKAGYHMVTIGKPDAKNPACKYMKKFPRSIWGWHPSFDGNNGVDTDACRGIGRPAVWNLVEKYNIDSGCGNGHQVQIYDYQDVILNGTFNTTDSEDIKQTIQKIKTSKFVEAL